MTGGPWACGCSHSLSYPGTPAATLIVPGVGAGQGLGGGALGPRAGGRAGKASARPVVGWDQPPASAETSCPSGHKPPPSPGVPQRLHCGWDHPRRQAGWLHTSEGQEAQPVLVRLCGVWDTHLSRDPSPQTQWAPSRPKSPGDILRLGLGSPQLSATAQLSRARVSPPHLQRGRVHRNKWREEGRECYPCLPLNPEGPGQRPGGLRITEQPRSHLPAPPPALPPEGSPAGLCPCWARGRMARSPPWWGRGAGPS